MLDFAGYQLTFLFTVQGWLMQIHQPMQLLPPTMRLCWHLCCQCLPVRLSWRVYRLALRQHLPLLAEGFFTLRLVITVWQHVGRSCSHMHIMRCCMCCSLVHSCNICSSFFGPTKQVGFTELLLGQHDLVMLLWVLTCR